MGKMGIGVCRSTRNLGVDFGVGGNKIIRKIQKVKWAEAKSKFERALKLGWRAAPSITRSGLLPSICYGAEVIGVTDGMLKGWRTMVARSYGNMGGRSVSARLALEDSDPGKQLVVEAVMSWVCAWWDDLMPKSDMYMAWRHAIKTVGMAARPNAEVRGGAGAFFAALRRINWTSPAPEAIRTRSGTTLYFGEGRVPEGTCRADPRAVRRWVLDEYELSAAMCSQVARDINDIVGVRGYPRIKDSAAENGDEPTQVYGETAREDGLAVAWRKARFELVEEAVVPWYWPAMGVVRRLRRSGMRKAAASLRACMEGGWLTQRRLWAEGRAETDRCKCGKASGTLWHKLAGCQLSQAQRDEAVKPHKLDELLAQGRVHVWDPLFSRGVLARPKFPAPPRATRWWAAEDREAAEIATGDVYTDGSALGLHWRAVRAGWAAVAVKKEGKIVWRMGGGCGEPHASILRAELTAVLETLKIAVAPICIHVDNATVVRGFDEGPEWCTTSGRDGADIWRDIWACRGDIGDGVSVVKV